MPHNQPIEYACHPYRGHSEVFRCSPYPKCTDVDAAIIHTSLNVPTHPKNLRYVVHYDCYMYLELLLTLGKNHYFQKRVHLSSSPWRTKSQTHLQRVPCQCRAHSNVREATSYAHLRALNRKVKGRR